MSIYYSDGTNFHEITPALIGAEEADVEIGGRNLIPNTTEEEQTATYPDSGYKDYYQSQMEYMPNELTYTLSFWAKSTVAGDKIYTYWYNPSVATSFVTSTGQTGAAADTAINWTLSTTMTKYWATMTLSEPITSKRLVICPRLVKGQGTGTITWSKVKFEAGDKATDWCPSLKDLDSKYAAKSHTHNYAGSSSAGGVATSAAKLSTARNLGVALGSTTAVTFDGSANQTSIPVSGTLPIANGGTGSTTAAAARSALGAQAAGNYMTSYVTSGDIDALWVAVRNKHGATGSVSLTKKESGTGSEIPAGWYNFYYSPHRDGIGNDSNMYGTIILTPMTFSGDSWILRVSNNASAVTEVKKILNSGNPEISISSTEPTNSNIKLWIKI